MAKKKPVFIHGKSPKRVKSMMKKYQGTPDIPTKKARFIGKYTHIGQQDFLFQMFEANELAPKDQKLTNQAMQELLLKEFPHNGSIRAGFKSGNKTINYYRYHYNLGRYSKPRWQPPLRLSYRYNEFGIIVDCRTGKIPLSHLQRERYARRYFGAYSARQAKEQSHESSVSPDPVS